MIAASPEIVEALNSPEILALAARTAAEKKVKEEQQPPPPPTMPLQPAPQPAYPMVGYGVSDEDSVLSEMTTPTVMTRQTVEEDEFYPEVDGGGLSSSGRVNGPRRIGLRVGVSTNEERSLPPPPPNPINKNGTKMRPSRIVRKPRAIAPLSKIAENHDARSVKDETGSTDSEEDNDRRPPARKGSWSSKDRKEQKIEPHPFFGDVGVGTVPRPARHNSYNTRARRNKARGINRNRSMPTNMQKIGNAGSIVSGSSGSFGCNDEGDDQSKASSECISNASTSISTAIGSNATPTPQTQTVRSKPGMSQPRTNILGSRKIINGTPKDRSILRNRSMPLKVGGGSITDSSFKVGSSVVSGSSRSLDGDTESDDYPFTVKTPLDEGPPVAKDGRYSFQNTGEKTHRRKSIPRMRMVPVVNKSMALANSSPAKMMTGLELKKPQSRSLSKYSNINLTDSLKGNSSSDDDDNRSRVSAPVKASESRSAKTLISSETKKSRSRSLSKCSKRNLRDSSLRGNNSSDDDDSSPSSAPIQALEDGKSSAVSTESGSAKVLIDSNTKKLRSRSLSKYSNRNSSNALTGNSSSDDDDDVSRASAPVISSTDSGKRLFQTPKSNTSFSKNSYRRSTNGNEDDDNSQPSLPVRVSTDGDEDDEDTQSNLSSDTNSLSSDSNTYVSSTCSEDVKERPSVTRRWKPPPIDNDALPPAFRLSGSNHSGKLSTSNRSRKFSTSNHSGKFSASDHSQKSSEGTLRVLKKGREPGSRSRLTPSNKTSSEEEKESRTEEQNITSSSDSEEDFVRQTVRKHGKSKTKEVDNNPRPNQSGKSKTREVDKNPRQNQSGKSKSREVDQNPRPNQKSEEFKQKSAEFQKNLTELTQVIQGSARPSDYLTGADAAFAATRKKKVQPKKNDLGKSLPSAQRSTDWLGSGVAKKRTWRVKGVKEIS